MYPPHRYPLREECELTRVFLLILISFYCISGESEKGFKVDLRNRISLRVDEVAEEKNMLIFVETNGQVTVVSKDLVNWSKVHHTFPPLYELYCPEETKRFHLNQRKNVKKRVINTKKDRKEVTLTNSDIKKMKPYKYRHLFSDVADKSPSTSKGSPSKNQPRDNKKIIKVIARGNQVTLKNHLEKGRYVIFDFFADWCGPCRRLTPALEAVVGDFPGHIALKKIDIQSWKTPVAQQYGLRSIPYVERYDPKGKKVGGVGARNVDQYLRGKARDEKW